MSDLDVNALRVALAATGKAARGMKQGFAYVPDALAMDDLPAVIIGNPRITYARNFQRGHATLELVAVGLVPKGISAASGTALLDGMVSQLPAVGPLPATLAWALRQSAGTDARPWTVAIDSASEYGLYRFDSVDYLGVELELTIRT